MCIECEVNVPEIDLSSVRLCAHCGEPLPEKYPNRKYHSHCVHAASRKYVREYMRTRKDRQKELLTARKEKGRCQCCGINPIGENLRFLCSRCFEWDGDGWVEYYHLMTKTKGQEVRV